jgi:hypothetical protein
MLSDFDSPEENQEENNDNFTDQFVTEYIASQKKKIETRNLISEMLFFTSCQVASASLAVILFQFAVEVVFTSWLCLFVAIIPSIASLCEVNFQKHPDGWSLTIMNRPFIAVFKFISGVGIAWISIHLIHAHIAQTQQAFNQTYKAIERYESPSPEAFLPPFAVQGFIAAVAIVSVATLIKTLRDRNPF